MLDTQYASGHVANLLTFSTRKAVKMIDSGVIPCWRIPPDKRTRRVPALALAAYLATQDEYREFLRHGTIRPSKFTADEIAELVAMADEIAESAGVMELATAG